MLNVPKCLTDRFHIARPQVVGVWPSFKLTWSELDMSYRKKMANDLTLSFEASHSFRWCNTHLVQFSGTVNCFYMCVSFAYWRCLCVLEMCCIFLMGEIPPYLNVWTKSLILGGRRANCWTTNHPWGWHTGTWELCPFCTRSHPPADPLLFKPHVTFTQRLFPTVTCLLQTSGLTWRQPLSLLFSLQDCHRLCCHFLNNPRRHLLWQKHQMEKNYGFQKGVI